MCCSTQCWSDEVNASMSIPLLRPTTYNLPECLSV